MDRSQCLAAVQLHSRRLVLEPLRVDHADELAAVLDDVALHAFTGGAPARVEELRARFEHQARGRSPDGRDCWLNWTVRERATGAVMGTVQATLKAGETDVIAELAWVIATTHQRQGFAKEAARVVAGWLRERGIGCLRAHIHPGHEASMAVARSIGLVRTTTVLDGELRWQSTS